MGYLNEPVCQLEFVDHCAVFSDFKDCTVCSEGYFLTDDGSCLLFPID